MRKVWMGAGLALTVVLTGMFVVGTVFAQAPTVTPAPSTPWGLAWGGICRGGSEVSSAITDLLGVTPGQMLDARQDGKTLLELAKEKGVTEQQLTDALVNGRKDSLDQAVKDGQLTQEQADWMLEKMKATAPFQLDNPFGGGTGPRGRMGRWDGEQNDRFSGMGPGGGGRGGRFGGMMGPGGQGSWGNDRTPFGGPRGNRGPWNNTPTTPATPAPSGTSST